MMIAVFALGLGFSGYALYDDVRRRRGQVPRNRRFPAEIHLVAAMVAGAGAGLAWGSLWGILAFVVQAFGGMFAASKLRK